VLRRIQWEISRDVVGAGEPVRRSRRYLVGSIRASKPQSGGMAAK